MKTLHVTGGALTSRPLRASGHKHSIVPIVAASVCLPGPVILRNASDITDTRTLLEILEHGGADARMDADVIAIDTTSFSRTSLPEELTRAIHGSVYLIPAVLGRFGQVQFGGGGGCKIGSHDASGARPLHHMVAVLEHFGATFTSEDGCLIGRAGPLQGCDLDMMDYSDRRDILTGPLVSGATKTSILAAMCTEGTWTRIRNPYPKPDVTELLAFVESRGGEVVRGPNQVDIRISRGALAHATEYRVISDLSEVMTYICLSVVQRMPVTITNVEEHKLGPGLAAELRLLEEMGVRLAWRDDSLHVSPPDRVRNVDIEVTSVGIYSDHQPFFALMMLGGDRPSRIREQVWKGRFAYARELSRMGANIEFFDNGIVIHPSSLREGDVEVHATELRGAATLVLAALSRRGHTIVRGAEHLQRGYQDLVAVLQGLGARIS